METKVGLKGNQHICRCKNCHNLFYVSYKPDYVLKKWIHNRLEYFCSYKCYKEFGDKKQGEEEVKNMNKAENALGYQMINKKIVMGKYKRQDGLLILQGKGTDVTDKAIGCVFQYFKENLDEQKEKNDKILTHEMSFNGEDEILLMISRKDWEKMKQICIENSKKEKAEKEKKDKKR